MTNLDNDERTSLMKNVPSDLNQYVFIEILNINISQVSFFSPYKLTSGHRSPKRYTVYFPKRFRYYFTY